MLEFIEEIIEARMYKGSETLSGKAAENLAKVVFLMFAMLEIYRYEKKIEAKIYAVDTIGSDNFLFMRSSATDLRNLLVVLNNQDKFSSKIKTNKDIHIPVLQIKRYLRDIENDIKHIEIDRSFFKTLEDYLKIKEQGYKNIRMNVADWEACSDTEKKQTKLSVKRFMQSTEQQNDLYRKFF